MNVKAGYSTPMLHVNDIRQSIAFYNLLGFETIDVDPGWARIHCEGGALMFLQAEEPHTGPTHDRFLLYLYTPDLPALREQLVASGMNVPPIKYPDYMPSGELTIKDPDGYTVLIGHWSDTEHAEWERQLREKRAVGIIP